MQRNYSIFYFYQGPEKTSLTVKLKPPTLYVINSVRNTFSIELEFTLKITHKVILQSIKIGAKQAGKFSY